MRWKAFAWIDRYNLNLAIAVSALIWHKASQPQITLIFPKLGISQPAIAIARQMTWMIAE